MKHKAVILAVLIVLSGCGSSGSATPTMGSSATSSETATVTESPTPTETPTATPIQTPTALPPQNPWRVEPVAVAIIDQTNSARNWTPIVQETIQYWNENATKYTDFEVKFVLIDSASAAEVVIQITNEVAYCSGFDEKTVGCAPHYEYVGSAGSQTVIDIEAGYTNEYTIETLKHEFGHTLALTHEDGDTLEFMAAKSIVNETSKPNATEKEWPWRQSNFSVYVEAGSGYTEQKATQEVKEALSYYEEDPDDWLPTGVSFELTDNESAADLRIELRASPDCAGGEGVCWLPSGYSVDGDSALEYYTKANVTVVGVNKDYAGWYVGYGLGRVFGAETESELPPPFADSDDADDHWFE